MKNKISKLYNRLTIRQKITSIYSCVFVIMTIVVSIIALLNMWVSYSSVSKSEINEVADRIEEYIRSNSKLDKAAIESLVDNPYISVRVCNEKDLDILFGALSGLDMFPAPPSEGTPLNDKYGRDRFKDIPYMFMHRVVVCNDDVYDIMIFRKNLLENRVLGLCLIIIICTNLISVLIAVFIGKLISKKIINPINEITTAAENISLYDLSQRITVPETKDEIQTLVITFNDMISRLQDSFEKENRFISDASHELKTPIAVIQGYINMVDRWGKEDSEVLEEAIGSIKSETEYMGRLIEQLLYIARDIQNNIKANMSRLKLNDIAEEVKKEIEITFDDADVLFINTNSDDVIINADEHFIKQLIWIFADNSYKYKGDKKLKLEIEVGHSKESCYFAVKDNGIGISKENINNIFDRFYRCDESRNKTIDGTGLGLSIAKAIAKTLNAEINVKSELGKGTEFIVKFPIS